MAQTPRTPVHWPRMKVRGRRNKEKTAARHRFRTVLPHATMTQESPNKARFDAIVEWQPGCFRIEIDRVSDGWGREVEPQRIRALPAPEPRPEPTFSMQFKVENRMSDEIWSKLFGERAS